MQHLGKTLPLLHRRRAAQLPHHGFKPGTADGDTQITLGQQHIPGAVGDHLKGLIQGPQDLGQGVVAGPTGQAAPKRWPRFELIAPPFKTVGGPPRLAVGLEQQHLTPGAGAERGTAQPADATPDHDNVNPVLHPATPDPAIIVIAASLKWPAAG